MDIKVVFICAGYGTRLEKDIRNNLDDENCAKLLGASKALLPIGGKPLLAHWVKLLSSAGIDHFYVVTNNRHYGQFLEFSHEYHGSVSLLNDGTNNNDERMGAVAGIHFAIQHFKLESSNVLVVGGDTLLLDDFDMNAFLSTYKNLSQSEDSCGLVTTYRCGDTETSKHGILEVDGITGKVVSLIEKPQPHETESRLACPCFYMLSPACTALVKEFLSERENAPMVEKDATGHLIKYLISHSNIFHYKISGRFDVGNLESYKVCDAYFRKHGHLS